MSRTRQVVVVAIVATALFADRAVAAAPSIRPVVAQAAGRLVRGLSVRFRRVVRAIRFGQQRQTGTSDIGIACVAMVIPILRRVLSPLQLHMPPPALA